MLSRLSIRDIVLIDKLDIDFVGELYAAQDQVIIVVDAAFFQQRANRMLTRDLERRSDLALLLALAHERGVTPRAERHRKGIE